MGQSLGLLAAIGGGCNFVLAKLHSRSEQEKVADASVLEVGNNCKKGK